MNAVDFSQRNRFGWENAIFVGNEQKLTDQITMQYGLRGSHYAFIGSGFRYDLGDRATPVDSRVVLNQQEFKDFQNLDSQVKGDNSLETFISKLSEIEKDKLLNILT